MRSRKNGEGSYSTVLVKGVEYQRFRYPDGKQIYARTMKELKAKKDKYENEPANNTLREAVDLTLCDVMRLWLNNRKSKIELTTYDSYYSIIDNHFVNHKLGNYQVSSITPDMITKFLATQSDKYSLVTISLMRYIIKASLRYAVEEEIISEFNFDRVKTPGKRDVKAQRRKIRIVSPEDIDKIYNEATRRYVTGNYIHPDVYRMIVFIMYTGLRVGEATALQWSDIEKDFSAIHIQRNAGRIKNRNDSNESLVHGRKTIRIIKSPKSEKGIRTIPLPERAQGVIKELSQEEHEDNDVIFKSSRGNMVTYNAARIALKNLITNAECDYADYTLHGLRHTYGSLLISKGVDIKIVSELLGHSNVAFTYDVYIGVLKEDKIKAVAVLNNL